MSKILNDISLNERERINLHIKEAFTNIENRISELESNNVKIRATLQVNDLVIDAALLRNSLELNPEPTI